MGFQRSLSIQLVCLRCHDEIFLVQPPDFVGPPDDGHLPPFRQDGGVVVFFIGYLCHMVGEGHRLIKILELETFFQARFTLFFVNPPARKFSDVLTDITLIKPLSS